MMIQCVPESLSLKRAVIRDLDGLAHEGVIIASNSSSYTITEIMESVRLRYPERFVSLHSCKFNKTRLHSYIHLHIYLTGVQTGLLRHRVRCFFPTQW